MKRKHEQSRGLLLCSFAVAVMLASVVQAQTPENSVPAWSNVDRGLYPRNLPGHRVIFQVKVHDAKRVQIDLGKMYGMKRDSQGVWSVTTEPQGTGFHSYYLVIDGIAVADPASRCSRSSMR